MEVIITSWVGVVNCRNLGCEKTHIWVDTSLDYPVYEVRLLYFFLKVLFGEDVLSDFGEVLDIKDNASSGRGHER